MQIHKGKNRYPAGTEYLRLKLYLSRFENCRRALRDLRERRARLTEEFPLPAGQPESTYGDIRQKVRAAALQSVQEKLDGQLLQSLRSLQEMLDMLALLPDGSDARTILEYRYIDGLTWQQISARMQLSVRWCCARRDAGLRRLWQDGNVRDRVNEWTDRWYPYVPQKPAE
jgi:DNA-directed RNA polymerase specialized sigma24 family protein